MKKTRTIQKAPALALDIFSIEVILDLILQVLSVIDYFTRLFGIDLEGLLGIGGDN